MFLPWSPSIFPELIMFETVDQADGTVGLDLLFGFPVGGRVDRNQALFECKSYSNIGHAEITLDQHIIPRVRRHRKPGFHRFQISSTRIPALVVYLPI
jgi:hypothetical protein